MSTASRTRTASRLEALASYRVLDTPPEESFDRLARLAARRFGVPFAAVNLIDDTRCFFKAIYGADVREVPLLDATPCLTVLDRRESLVVPDARADARYRDFPLVVGEPHVRFYATAPIEDADGFVLGTLFIADTRPRELSSGEVEELEDFAGTAADLLTARRTEQQLAAEREARVAVTESTERIAVDARDVADRVRRDRALRESEERFAKTFRGYPLAAAVVSLETGRVMLANPAFAKTTGYGLDEIEGRDLYDLDLVLDEAHEGRRDVLEAMAAHGHEEPYDGPYRTRGGEIRHAEFFFERIEISGERCMVMLLHDVTDQNRAEAQADREREFADAIINSLPGVFYVHDGTRVIRWNRNMERVTGYTEDELTSLGVTDFVAETDLLLERIQEAFTLGSASMEGHVVTKAGERIPYIMTGQRTILNDKTYVVGVGIDISEQRRSEDDLRRARHQLERAEHSALVMTAHIGLDGSWLKVPPGLCDLLGYDEEELRARSVQEIMHPEDWEAMRSGRRRIRSGEIASFEMEKRFLRKDGRYVWVYGNDSLVRDQAGNAQYLLAYVRDISEQKRAEAALCTRARQQAAVARLSHFVLAQASLQEVFDEAAHVVASTLDVSYGGIIEMPPGGDVLITRSGIGWSASRTPEVRDREAYSMAEMILASDEPLVFSDLRSDSRVSSRDRLHEVGVRSGVGAAIPGRHRPFGVVAAFSTNDREFNEDDANFLHAVANLLSGAIAQRSLLDELAVRAEHDDLTGLPNRSNFLACLEGAVAEARVHGTMVAVLFLDLDRFKHINDSLGHHAGDELLKGVSRRLTDLLREGDVLARLAGDEFVIMLSGIRRKSDAAEVTHRILTAFDAPFAVAGRVITVKATVGIALYPEDAQAATSLLRGADAAMYQGKSVGRNTFQFFTAEMNTKATERLDLESDLRQALPRNEFELHYQPQVDLDTREVIGFEALLRWHHPTRGLVPPDRFVPIAEDTGLIVPIGEWVMREAFGQLAAWKDAGAGPLRMAVNVAAAQFTQAGFSAGVLRITKEAGLHPDEVELEITESVVLHDADLVAKELATLETLGFRVALDDFGTGYSSLAYLRDLPIDRIKIDRAFTRQIDGDDVRGGTAFVEAMIGLAKSLRLDVVAEGIESEEQVRVLRELGCAEGQGYLFAKPMPANDVRPRLPSSSP